MIESMTMLSTMTWVILIRVHRMLAKPSEGLASSLILAEEELEDDPPGQV